MNDRRNIKKNCTRKAPYDWSDILEKAKDDTMRKIAEGSSEHTSYYWNLSEPTDDCPNWIAKWFLYHKFRYRDGRNRNPIKDSDSTRTSSRHDRVEDGRASVQYEGSQDTSRYPESLTYGMYNPSVQ